ncbi:unnamed protein product, partial [marine sediment metagenome]
MGATAYQNLTNRTAECEGATFDVVFYGTGVKDVLSNYGSPFYSLIAGSYLSGGVHHMRRTFVDFNIPDFPDSINFISLWLYFIENVM